MAKQKTSKTKTAQAARTVKASAKTVAKKVTNRAAVAGPLQGAVKKLRMWNFRIGVLLVLEAAAVVLFGKNVAAPVTTQYLAVDSLASQATGGQVLATASRHLFDVPMVWAVAAFLLLLAAVHIAAATLYRRRYEAALDRGVSEFRWMGFGLSGAALLVAISLISGVHQLSSLVMIAVFMIAGSLLVLAAEVLSLRGPKQRVSHLICGLGLVSVIMPWVVLK